MGRKDASSYGLPIDHYRKKIGKLFINIFLQDHLSRPFYFFQVNKIKKHLKVNYWNLRNRLISKEQVPICIGYDVKKGKLFERVLIRYFLGIGLWLGTLRSSDWTWVFGFACLAQCKIEKLKNLLVSFCFVWHVVCLSFFYY